MKEIKLSRSLVALIDASDYCLVMSYSWYAHTDGQGGWYACHSISPYQKLFMHKLILPTAQQVDHINRNGLDNRRENLRSATNAQNCANKGLSSNNTSGFKGVSRRGEKWTASIKVNYRQINLGTHDTAELAASAYDKAAIEYFGEFARTNEMMLADGYELNRDR